MSNKVKISAVGCALADYVYSPVDFTSAAFQRYSSRKPGDGGLVPGQLVFLDALARFAGEPEDAVIAALAGKLSPKAVNVGGPAIVAAINAAQLAPTDGVKVDFYGAHGDDEAATFIQSVIATTAMDGSHYRQYPGSTPFTKVFSDPAFHGGKGERTFVNNVGAAAAYTADALGEDFFAGDVLFFSATALVPELHDHLTALLRKGKALRKLNIVATVFDFRNEMRDPAGRWPLGESEESYKYIDLLIVDWDEGRRLSGADKLEPMVEFFRTRGVGAMVITHGAKDFYLYSDGGLFAAQPLAALPVAAAVDEDLARHPERRGDTTGCGDNFAGGLLAAVAMQLAAGKPVGELDMADAAAWASASGGFACFCFGGTFHEKRPGEKYTQVKFYHDRYLEQIGRA